MKYFDFIVQKFSSMFFMWFLIMLVAIWSIYIQDGQINKDGLLYLKQAYFISEGSWKEGLAVYSWPFFSILIAFFHKISGLPLQLAAHAIDLVLFGIATLFYLKILRFISRQNHIIFYGGIMLLSFIPIMDNYVGMVLRDHGLWAGCMMGTYFYFRYLFSLHLTHNLLWQLSFSIAALFRPEALIFLVLIPIQYLILHRDKLSKWLVIQKSIQMYLIALGFAFFLFIYNVFIYSGNLANLLDSRLGEFIPRLVSFFQQINSSLPLTSNHPFLTDLLTNYPLTITFGVLLAILIVKWFKGIGLLLIGLLVYGISRGLHNHLNRKTKITLYFFIGTSFLIVSINLFNFFVLSNRYWVCHWFWLFIFITPFLEDFFYSKNSFIRAYLKPLVAILIIASIFCSLIDSHKDNIEQDAALFLKTNIKSHSVKLINAERVGYYSGLTIKELIEAANPELQNTMFLIYKGNQSDAHKILSTNYHLEKSFLKKDQGIFVFKNLAYVQ